MEKTLYIWPIKLFAIYSYCMAPVMSSQNFAKGLDSIGSPAGA